MPQRIVTLAPHLTELVYAAGAGPRIVGTLDTSDYPAEARHIERVGDSQHLDAERLLALKPDLVLLWGDGQPAAQRALIERLHLPTLALEEHALDDVARDVERLGQVLGTQAVASAEAALSSCVEGHIVMAGNPTQLEGPLWRAVNSERRLWHVVEITGEMMLCITVRKKRFISYSKIA